MVAEGSILKISELFGTDWVSRNPENPEIPELLGKLARIRGYDHSGVMSSVIFGAPGLIE